jgi:hypothetical protein
MCSKGVNPNPEDQHSCLYQCELCGTQERIPNDILEYFDVIDPGDPESPATFRCERCPGIMYPVSWFRA